MDASGLLLRDRWRFLRLLVVFVLLLAGGGTAIHLSGQVAHHADGMTRYVRVDVWAVQQVEYELQQFRAAFARHVAGEDGVTREAVRTRLAAARAAVPLLRRGPDYQDLRLLVDIDGAGAATLAALDRVERSLASAGATRANLTLLREVEEILDAPATVLRQLAVDMAHVRAQLQDGDLANVRWLTGLNRWLVTGFLIAAVIFIAFLLSETRAAKRAERAATDSERKTRHLAEHDPLTGLPNRLRFRRELDARIERARAADGALALHLLNLDGFKEINESFGQAFGDSLLVAVAERLGAALPAEALLVRLGSDEFAVVEDGVREASEPEALARSLLAACTELFRLEGREVHISAGLGVARFPDDGETGDSLLKCADLALTAAKREPGAIALFDREMVHQQENRKALEEDLRRALADGGLELAFQPQVTLGDRRCVGAEALLRWKHPTAGWISPASFIPIAEQSGLILPLGLWVLETACRTAKGWQALPEAVVAVNVSPAQFIHQDIVAVVAQVLAETGLPPRRLELEITEGILMHDERAAAETLERLHALGVQLAIDDFGTGYSSLSYLKRFKVDKLKIDRAFVNDLEHDPNDRTIVRTVVELAKGLGMTTIAEGIETPEQMAVLARLGCEEGQGYLISKPVPADEFAAWADRQQLAEQEAPLPLRPQLRSIT